MNREQIYCPDNVLLKVLEYKDLFVCGRGRIKCSE